MGDIDGMALFVGDDEGVSDGWDEGDEEGTLDGDDEGCVDIVGVEDGISDGWKLMEGEFVGETVG